MSIKGNMAKYELQKWTKGVDAYGNPTNTWTKVTDIQVSVNLEHDTVTNNDISYKVHTPTGLTEYKGLANDLYQIVGSKTYTIVSYYTAGRWTQLFLKAVS